MNFLERKLNVLFFGFFIGAILFCSALEGQAEEAVSLGRIVVSSKRMASEEDKTPDNILVYTEKDFQSLPVRDVSDVLSFVPGVDVQFNGSFGQSSALSIHGSESRQVLYMVDGIPFNTQLTGQANPNKISLEPIDHIEIIKGGASSAWGSSLGGVVNVITKETGKTARPSGTFKTSFSEFSTSKNSLEVSGAVGKAGYYLSGSYMSSDGIAEVTDAQEKRFFSKFSFPLKDQLKLTSSFGYSGAKVRNGITRSNRINATPYISRYGQILLDAETDFCQSKIAYKYNDQDITTDMYSAASGALLLSVDGRDFYQGISFVNSFSLLDEEDLVVGVDVDWHSLKSKTYLDSSQDISRQAPYVNYTYRWDKVDLVGELRYDNNDRFGAQVSPSVGAVYHFDKDHPIGLVRAKISKVFNAPPLLWLYNDNALLATGPNPDLKAEKAWLYELGAEGHLTPALKMELNLYRSDVKDALGTVLRNGRYIKENFTKFRRQGAELLMNYAVNESLSFYTSGAFNDVENRQTKEMVRDQGVARQSFRLGAQYKTQGGFSGALHGYYNRWSSPASAQPNDRKIIFDVRLSQEIKEVQPNMDLTVFLNIYNMTNSKYWSSISFPLPKRYFEGGFSLAF